LIIRAAEEAVWNPEVLRARVEVLADEVPMVELGGVDRVERDRNFARNFGMQARAAQQFGQDRDRERLGRGREAAPVVYRAVAVARAVRPVVCERTGGKDARARRRNSGGAHRRTLKQPAPSAGWGRGVAQYAIKHLDGG